MTVCIRLRIARSLEASDLTRMANTCESSSEPSSVSWGQRQLGPGQNGTVVGQCSRKMHCGTAALPGERRSLNGESMLSGERGNPDHSPRFGRQAARKGR